MSAPEPTLYVCDGELCEVRLMVWGDDPTEGQQVPRCFEPQDDVTVMHFLCSDCIPPDCASAA